MDNYNFRKSINQEYLSCFKLIKDRLSWMEEKGFNHWNSFDYLSVFPLDFFKNLQTKGELYVLIKNDEVLAFASIADDGDTYYLHHLTSKISDHSYGKEFLFRVFDYALSNDKKYVRLDSSKNYKALDDYYAELGFKEIGEVVDGPYIGSLKELKLLNKKELRKTIKEIKLDDKYKTLSSSIIQDKLIDTSEYKNASSIFVYLSTDEEVSTNKIIKQALLDKKKVFVPVCDKDDMKVILVDENTKFVKNSYGISEPSSGEEGNDIDLAIIPCISANRYLQRLGHGKGYYDKFLSKRNCFKVVLCFNKHSYPFIEMDEHDVYMDKYIDEKS